MLSRTKFAKFYIPGLISLVMLPLLCVGYLYYKGKFTKYYATDIAFVDDDWLDEMKLISKRIPGAKWDFFNSRKFCEMDIDGDALKNKKSIEGVSDNIKHLLITRDTLNGIKVRFGNNATYADLVNVVDICYRSDTNINFNFMGDYCYIYYIKPIEFPSNKIYNFTCGGVHVYQDSSEDKSWGETVLQYLSGLKDNIAKATLSPALFYTALFIWMGMLCAVLYNHRVRLKLFK